MRETTSAITRVALLVIMTGMFATAWSNDQRTQTAFIIARREAAQTTRQVAQVKVTPTTPVAHTTECSLDKQPVVMQVTVDLTLPPDITPGTFRVVQPTGRCSRSTFPLQGSVMFLHETSMSLRSLKRSETASSASISRSPSSTNDRQPHPVKSRQCDSR
ncbi:MAG: hypothetical protein R3B91_09040 [Planctomycetaceae bacterium]